MEAYVSDTLLSDGDAPMGVLGSSRKKLTAVKVVKKRSKLSKKRLASRVVPPTVVDSSLQETVAVETPSSRTSSLFRSSLASTFPASISKMVPLSRPRHLPSGRGGGLNDLVAAFSSTSHGPPGEGSNKVCFTGIPDQPESLDSVSQVDDHFHDAETGMVASGGSIAPPSQVELVNCTLVTPLHSTSLQKAVASSSSDLQSSVPTSPEMTQTVKFSEVFQDPGSPATPGTDLPSGTPNASSLIDSANASASSHPVQPANNSATPKEVVPHSVSQATTTTTKPKTTLRLHTFCAQLTFGLKPSQKVNVVDLFTLWTEASIKLLADFALLPFDGEKGTKVTELTHIQQGDPDFFTEYYGNHRSLVHGNLTGMVHFQTSTPWNKIKAFKPRYFSWLTDNCVFLNYTKFKTETLVPCGFLVGAHPGHFRRDEAEEELHASLGLEPGEILFQLSSRSVSVPIKEDDTRRYSFTAVVVETSTKHASQLRERFYDLSDPRTATTDYPYTGLYQFVPMVKSTDWPIPKIYQLARLHSSIINDLKAIYVHNI